MSYEINLKEDICPISEFRANTTNFLKRIKECHRPIVLTQNGKSSAILLDIGDYQKIIDELELTKDLLRAKDQIAKGDFLTNDEAHSRLMERFK